MTTYPQHPSDEEIGEFIGLFYTREEWAAREIDAVLVARTEVGR